MTIDRCSPSDCLEVAALYDEVTLYLTRHVNYPRWRYREYPSLSYVQAMIRTNSQFVIRRDNVAVGAFVLNEDPQGDYAVVPWSTALRSGEYLVLHALAVSPAAYRQGIASSAVDYALSFAKNKGYKGIRLDVVPTNVPAKKLYESKGFSYMGDYDLRRGYDDIPLFSLYELNF